MPSLPFPAVLRGHPAAVLLAALACLAPPLSLFSALGIAPLFTLAAVGLLVLGGWRDLPPRPLDRWQTLALGGLLLWALLACFRGPTDSAFALKSLAMTFGTVVVGTVVLQGARRLETAAWPPVLLALAAGLAVSFALLILLGGLWRSGLITTPRFVTFYFRMDRGATLAALLVWPALLGLWRDGRRRLALALAAAALVALLLTFALAAKVALLAGLAGLLLLGRRPRWSGPLLVAGVLAPLLLAPLAAERLPPPERSAQWPGVMLSMHHRMTIWRYAAGKIAEHPLIGWGYESSRSIAGKEEIAVPTRFGDVWNEPLMPLHPHNAALQIWLELGGIGAGLLALFLAATIRRLRPGPLAGPVLAARGAALLAGTTISLVSFGFWQSWWQCSLWLCAAFLSARSEERPPA